MNRKIHRAFLFSGLAGAAVTFPTPVLTVSSRLLHQATVTGDSVDAVLSDDPSLPGREDQTATRLFVSDANLESWLSWTLVVDSDGNTVPSPGDVVRFEGAVVNSGLAASDDIEVVLPLDAHSTLNVGGLSSSAGSIGSAEVDGVTEVTVSLTSLASNTTLLFDVEVTVGFLAAFEQVLAVQGEVSHDGTPWGFTDDPETLTVSDATVVPVSTTPWPERGDYTGPFPEVAITAPTGGARVATLTDVTGTVEATDGEEIVFWRLSLSAAGSEASVVLGEGFEEPSSADLGTLDPSLLQNGLWVLRLDAIDSGGLLGWTESPIEVAGDFKPGAMRVSFLDASYALPTGGDVSLVRTYDTLDRHERGDFGYGWNLSVLDLRVQTNGPLGAGGWGQESCGAAWLIGPLCYVAVKPHIVSLRWPDGTQESWNFQPKPTSSLFPYLAEPDFEARPGTTSDIDVVGIADGWYVGSTGSIYAGSGTSGHYNPTRFVVTKTDGSAWVVDAALGFVSMSDRFGNVLLRTNNGLEASPGPDLLWTRDGQGRITSLTLPDSEVISYSYTVAGDLDVVTDQAGNETEHVYGTEHRLERWNGEGLAAAAVWTYDGEGRVIGTEDGEGVGTLLSSFDLETFTTVETGPDARLTTTTLYGADGMPSTVTQSWEEGEATESYVTTYVYDTSYRPAEVTNPAGGVTTFTYDSAGRVLETEDPDGVVTERTYDAFGNVLTEDVGGVRVLTQTTDTLGRVLTSTDGVGAVRTVTYDAQGRPLTLTAPDERTASISYHPTTGLPTTIELPNSEEITLGFNANGQNTTTTKPGLGTVTNAYDDLGRRVSRTDERGEVQGFGYDAYGRMTSYTDKLGNTAEYAYDDAGRLETTTNRNLEVLTHVYDDAGRLESITGPGVDKEWTYDPLGRVLTARNGDVLLTKTYTAAGLASETLSHPELTTPLTQTWTRSLSGRQEGVEHPWGEQAYAYDARGRLTEVDDDALGAFGFGYDHADRVTSLSRPNGLTTASSYDAVGRVLAILTTEGGSPVHSMAWTYDADGRPATKTDELGTHTYTHDEANRLTAADHPSGGPLADESYTYDAATRRTSWANNPLAEVIYNDGDQLVQDSTWTYAYDDEGRRVTKTARFPVDTGIDETWTYTWNAAGALQSVENPESDTWTYLYDAEDRLVRVTGPTSEQWRIYDGLLARAVLSDTGTLVQRYVTAFGFGEVLASVDGSGAQYAVRDSLGSPVAWFPEVGSPVHVHRDSYGVKATPGPATYGYTGHAEDESGFVWGRARWVDSGSGGWLSPDARVDEPRYQYVWGASSFLVDPTGHHAVDYACTSRWAVGAAILVVAKTGIVYAIAVIGALAPVIDALDRDGDGGGGAGDSAEAVGGLTGAISTGAVVPFPLGGIFEDAILGLMPWAVCGL